MLLLNVFWRWLFLVFATSSAVFSAVLELGESELHGKKDQPEAMTFVARAELKDSLEVVHEKKLSDKIKQETKDKVFDLFVVGY